MDRLTPKQEAFALAYVETSNASESYRRAYNAGRMKPETVNRKAFDVLENGKVSARIDQLMAELAERSLWTREKSVEALISVINEPDKKSDVIQAVKELNAMHGYNAPEKLDVTVNSGVMLVPVVEDAKSWEQITSKEQARLKHDVRH